MAGLQGTIKQPWNVLWRKALISLPRALPTSITRLTSPQGPHPWVAYLPSRGRHQIPVYVFLPPGVDVAATHRVAVPVVVDFHGGGFIYGSCLEQVPFCAKLSRELGAVVLSVDYRLGPADKFPAAVEDAEDVLAAVLGSGKGELGKAISEEDEASRRPPGYAELRKAITAKLVEDFKNDKQGSLSAPTGLFQLDPKRVAMSGFSSGGNLALNLALSVGPPDVEWDWPSVIPETYDLPIPMLLFYPSLDARQLPSERPRPPGLPIPTKGWQDIGDTLMPTYLDRTRASHPRASPGLAPIHEGLHPSARMLLVLPGLDTLAEQSEVWIEKVEREGRASHLRVERFPSMKHGWTQYPESWLSAEERRTREVAFDQAIDFVRGTWEEVKRRRRDVPMDIPSLVLPDEDQLLEEVREETSGIGVAQGI